MGRAIHECQCRVCQAGSDSGTQERHQQMNVLLSKLNEAQRRWYVGSLSQATAGPSDRELSRITGLDTKTIRRGRQELSNGEAERMGERQRLPGGGRPKAEKKMKA
jgi:hypothetical protein